MMTMMLGTVLIRPLVHIGTALLLLKAGYFSEYSSYIMAPILVVALWFITDLSTFLCRCFLRISCTIRRNIRTHSSSRSKDWNYLRTEFEELSEMLGVLK